MIRLFKFRTFSGSYRTMRHRCISSCSHRSCRFIDGFDFIEEPLTKMWRLDDEDCSFLDETAVQSDGGAGDGSWFTARQQFIASTKNDAMRVLEVLQEDTPGFDSKAALRELRLSVSGLLVREVLLGILRSINHTNKNQCAKSGFKFFEWSGSQENYEHTANSYHLMMRIYAECDEFKAMWWLVDKMMEKGFPTTARTFNILICACGKVGLAKRVVERFIKSKNFNFRPFKHSYNAILHCLIAPKQYKLIEWVYQQMHADGHSPDILTFNVIMCASYRLGKLDKFDRLLDEMSSCGFSPDFHTYNILLHVLGKGNRPDAALNLLNHMREVGFEPSVLHITTLMDGLSRAGNIDACRYFFDQMIKNGCIPDVVCYTVIITGYVVASELEKAKELFDEMITNGQLPNVFTYNSMIRGLCMAGRFSEARSLFKEMKDRGCSPNFLVYSTLVSNLRNAGRLSEAHEIIRQMVEQGQYAHLVSKVKVRKR